MAECYKLLFDLSLFYTIFGYFLSLVAGTPPSIVCFLALAAAVMLDSFLRFSKAYENGHRALRLLPLLLPLLSLLFRPTLPQILHALLIWLYLSFSMFTDRVEIDYSSFRSHFSFGMWMLFLMIFGPLFPGRFTVSLIGAVPYLVCMLICGVCLLRMLREQRPDGLRQGIYIAVFIMLCALLTIGKAPQLLLRAFGFIYRTAIAPLIFGAAILLAVAFYGFYLFAAWLVSRAQGNDEPLQINMQGAAEMLGIEDQYKAYTADLRWLRTLLIVLGVALLLFLIYRLFLRLMGDRVSVRAASPWKERGERAADVYEMQRMPGVLRPRDPRLAVRWYYGHFLTECRRRGVPLMDGTTAGELAALSVSFFPGADPAALTELYLPARYDPAGSISAEDARRAAELWKDLKRTIDPTDIPLKHKRKKA